MTRRPLTALALATASTVAALASIAPALATTTERFVLDDAAILAAGELERTAVHSDGRVTIGPAIERVALPDEVALVYSSARGSDGAIYLGTGNDGKIYRARGGNVELFAETGQLLVAAMAFGDGGALYAGTLPEGRIYRVAPDGTVAEVARPDGVEHVWDLAWDAQRNVLYAATGPEGRVYAIEPGGRATIRWDSTASHVMSLALAPGGALYAGTSDDALVVRIEGTRVTVVHDFEGNEITALALRDGVLAVGANEFPEPPAVMPSHAKTPVGPTTRAPRPRPGKGRIWRVGTDGRAERLFAQDEGHVTSLAFLDDGAIVAGTGAEGRVVRVNADRTTTTWIDVDERQVLDVSFGGTAPAYFVTGDGAALYRVTDGRPRDATWNSKVLDARFVARWGQLDWRGDGQLVLQTRSGNTAEPDETWSDWSAELTASGPIRSVAARYLQVRARFTRDPDAVLRAVTIYFLPQNQRAYVTEVRLEGPNKAATDRMRAERQAELPEPSTTYKLAWTVENPDGDRLRYRVRYRQEGQQVWREMLRSDNVLTSASYDWQTQAIADGWYVVRVEASDELDNPDALVLRDARDSEPIRVDNHAPRVEELRFAGARLSGRAVDGLGPIARLEYAVDGGDWIALFPEDDLFDGATERFEVDLSALAPGVHVVSVRATDAGGNAASAEAQIRR